MKVYVKILDFIEWLSSDDLSEFEKGIMRGLQIAETIAECIEEKDE